MSHESHKPNEIKEVLENAIDYVVVATTPGSEDIDSHLWVCGRSDRLALLLMAIFDRHPHLFNMMVEAKREEAEDEDEEADPVDSALRKLGEVLQEKEEEEEGEEAHTHDDMARFMKDLGESLQGGKSK